MLLAAASILFGFIALIWSANLLVAGAASIARNLGVSPLIIGLTVVSLGTSAPEILVSLTASLSDAGPLAIGNAIGSNIANIGLVLGITAIITPLPFSRNVRRKELPWLLGATFLAVILMFDRHLGFVDGLILLLGLAYILWQLVVSQSDPEYSTDAIADELDELPEMTNKQSIFWLAI